MGNIFSHKKSLIQGGLLVAGVSLQGVGCGEIRYRDGIQPTQQVHRIEVHGDVGVIEVVPSDVAKIDFAVRAPEGAAHVQHTEFDGVLVVNTRCRTPILCSVDAEVHVPSGVQVEIELDRGEVWATGVGDIDVSVGEGEVDLETSGRTTVQLGQGAARVVSASSEQIRIAVGSGDIDVRVSPSSWNISLVAASEIVRGVAHDGDAVGSMELFAPAGTVTVRALSPSVGVQTP